MTELTQQQIDQAESHIAYEGTVEFKKWIDTSAHGFKVTLGLESRAELDAFDGVMTMRRKRGGQRYHAIVQPYWYPDGKNTPGEPDPSQQFQEEWQFAGRGWAETQGAHIAIHIGDRSAIAHWRLRTAADQVEAEVGGSKYYILLMELDDDETIINQTKRARAIEEPPPKGGARSRQVARLILDPDFAQWLHERSAYKNDAKLQELGDDAYVKMAIGCQSKIELDHGNERAWELWERQFHGPFIRSMGRP